LALLLGVVLLYGAGLGARDLWAPDEPRYGAIAEELRSFRHGARGLVLLHLNDVPYTQKPPLYFWLAALAGVPGGRVDEWAARLPSALAGIGCVVWTAILGRWLFRRPEVALLAAGLLATSFRFAFSARRVQLDVLLVFFELSALAAFLWLELRRGGVENAREHPGAIAGLHGALGAAALVKGPVAWLPLAILGVFLVWEGRRRAFGRLFPVWSWLLLLGPVSLWIVAAAALAPTGFAETAVSENLFGRFFAGTSHARPIYYYLYQLPLDFLPWSLLGPLAGWSLWRTARAGERSHRFVIVWVAVPLVFFSLSAGKRGIYMLPVFPALALAVAAGLADFASRRVGWERWKRGLAIAIAAVASIELILFTLGPPRLEDEKSPRPIAHAAAARLAPGAPLGVYGLRPIEGGIAYYGDVRIASLENEEALDAFLRVPEGLVLMRARHFDAMTRDLDLVVVERFRSGRRELVLTRVARGPSRERGAVPDAARSPGGARPAPVATP